MHGALCGFLLWFGVISGAMTGAALGQESPSPTIRGITISTHGGGREWADADRMGPTMRRIRATGATWVALHPYASVRADGRVRWRRFARRGASDKATEAPARWYLPIRYAHEAGLKVLIKPHLAYWGSPFRWRGEIRFHDDARWRQFFGDYRAWIERIARGCAAADGFVVGTELDGTISHERDWRAIIAGVRKATKAPLTYAANWTDYERVPFWNALDIIGIQAYFPLCDDDDPTSAELTAAWATRMADLRRFAERTHKDIVFTELGYNTSFKAAREPWVHRSDGKAAEPLQLRCIAAALAAIEHEPRVRGSFLWKWFPEPRAVGRDFPLATRGVLGVLAQVWRSSLPQAARRK